MCHTAWYEHVVDINFWVFRPTLILISFPILHFPSSPGKETTLLFAIFCRRLSVSPQVGNEVMSLHAKLEYDLLPPKIAIQIYDWSSGLNVRV